MTGRVLSGFGIATLVTTAGMVSAAVELNAAQAKPPTLTSAPTIDTRPLSRDASGMVALQRHAQVAMLLDGRRDTPQLASVRLPAKAVALTLPAAAR